MSTLTNGWSKLVSNVHDSSLIVQRLANHANYSIFQAWSPVGTSVASIWDETSTKSSFDKANPCMFEISSKCNYRTQVDKTIPKIMFFLEVVTLQGANEGISIFLPIILVPLRVQAQFEAFLFSLVNKPSWGPAEASPGASTRSSSCFPKFAGTGPASYFNALIRNLCNLGGQLDNLFLKIDSRGLWSVFTVQCFPKM